MLTVLLVIHLLTAIFLVSLILMQRSEGGALSGLGGGSGANSFLNARGKGNLLTKTTAILATIFFITSISLSIYNRKSEVKTVSILDSVPSKEDAVALDIPTVPTAEVTEDSTNVAEEADEAVAEEKSDEAEAMPTEKTEPAEESSTKQEAEPASESEAETPAESGLPNLEQ